MKNGLYSLIWRWHLYAGLIVAPFMIILAISGSVYLFKPQLDRIIYPNLTVVTKSPTPALAESALIEKLHSSFPKYKISKYFSPAAFDESARFDVISNKGILSIFLNPYTGDLLGYRLDSEYVQNIAKKIHGELLLGTLGDYWVELMACWGFVLIITGLFLVLPKELSTLKSVFVFNLKHKSTRWRSIHISSGIYGSMLILFLILSGLPWTGFWGDKILHSWDHYPDKMFSNVPESRILSETLNKETKVVPWAVEKIPLPSSNGKGTPISLSEAIERSLNSNMTKPFIVSFPQNPKGVFTVSASTGNPRNERVIHIDQYSGKILASVDYNDYSPMAASIQYGIALHEGKLFGLFNQLIGLFACLMLIFISISGVVLWWKRRPSKSIDKFTYFQKLTLKEKVVLVTAIILVSAIFPLLGASIAVIGIMEFLCLKLQIIIKKIN